MGSRMTGIFEVEIAASRVMHISFGSIAVDFGRARSTFARLAIPSHRQIRDSLLRLNQVNRVQNNHAFLDLGRVVLKHATRVVISAPDAKMSLLCPSALSPGYFISSITALNLIRQRRERSFLHQHCVASAPVAG